MGMLLELMAEDLSAAETPRDRRILTQLKTLQRECQHLEDILNAFLQFARVGEVELVESDVNQLVRDFIEFYKAEAHDHGIEISPHLASDLPPVRADRALFRQMLLNLALNAQQAMPDGGIMELQTSVSDGCDSTGPHRQRHRHGRGDAGPAVRRLFLHARWEAAGSACRPFVKLSKRTRDASPVKASRDGEPGL